MNAERIRQRTTRAINRWWNKRDGLRGPEYFWACAWVAYLERIVREVADGI